MDPLKLTSPESPDLQARLDAARGVEMTPAEPTAVEVLLTQIGIAIDRARPYIAGPKPVDRAYRNFASKVWS